MFAVWKNQWVTVPCQELSLCPPCTANPDWGTGDSASGEFHCLPRHFTFPIQIHIFSLKLGTVEIFWARGFFLCFWGPPKVITAAEKAPQRALSQSFCTCPNSPPLESFIEWNICSLCFRTSFTFTFVLVWHLHKIQRVLKQMTVGT